jgi:hypothetical protein
MAGDEGRILGLGAAVGRMAGRLGGGRMGGDLAARELVFDQIVQHLHDLDQQRLAHDAVAGIAGHAVVGDGHGDRPGMASQQVQIHLPGQRGGGVDDDCVGVGDVLRLGRLVGVTTAGGAVDDDLQQPGVPGGESTKGDPIRHARAPPVVR